MSSYSGGVTSGMHFSNGWGVSVVKTAYSYGGELGLYELAVFLDNQIHYDNDVAKGDVVGYLTEYQVTELMIQVQDFNPVIDLSRLL